MTITVSCPACSTSFPVDPDKIPEGGVRAQCSVCPEIFGVDKPAEVASESPFAAEADITPDPSASVVLDEAAVPPEVQSPFGADAEVVADIAVETSNEFGEREITFDSGTEVETEVADSHDFASIQMDAPADDQGFQAPPAEAAPVAAEPPPAVPEAPSGVIQFGRRSPEDKARSLARSLVSDLIAYNPDKHKAALASGTLLQVFEAEIDKSWKEYREQVDPDVMSQGTFFNDALNELLAHGESVFNLEG